MDPLPMSCLATVKATVGWCREAGKGVLASGSRIWTGVKGRGRSLFVFVPSFSGSSSSPSSSPSSPPLLCVPSPATP